MATADAANDEEWLELAARDDHLVAALLLRLYRAVPPPALPTDWSFRQPRSGGPKEVDKMKAKQTRASPTSPLSWSGATSTSGGGGGDCPEESSRPARPPYNARSKVSIFPATSNPTAPTARRPKRKKTLAELKEEESLLLKERRSLRHEVAALRLIAEQERAKNDIFKRKKLDLQMLHTRTVAANPLGILPKARDSTDVATQLDTLAGNICAASSDESHETAFELPDLNAPLEELRGPEVLDNKLCIGLSTFC